MNSQNKTENSRILIHALKRVTKNLIRCKKMKYSKWFRVNICPVCNYCEKYASGIIGIMSMDGCPSCGIDQWKIEYKTGRYKYKGVWPFRKKTLVFKNS